MNSSTHNTWRRKKFLFIPIILVLFLAIAAVVMLLWNWLMPTIFQLPSLSFGQATGLLVLCRILFGGFHFGRKMGGRPPFANPAFRDKFMNMSEEEKAEFKEEWKKRCGK